MPLDPLDLESAFRRCIARHALPVDSPVIQSNPGRFGDYEADDYGDWDDTPSEIDKQTITTPLLTPPNHMNQTQQQVLVSRVTKLIDQLAPHLRQFRIQFADDGATIKSRAMAKFIKGQRAGIGTCQSKVRCHLADEHGVQESLLTPCQFMAAVFPKRVGLQPSGSNQVIQHSHE